MALSRQGVVIFDSLLPEWEQKFRIKNEDYGDEGMSLGIKGSFADIYRKTNKLKRALWDDKKLVGEQPREILMDVIGHCFLTIAELDREQQEAIQ
jgi:hypothetical protein